MSTKNRVELLKVTKMGKKHSTPNTECLKKFLSSLSSNGSVSTVANLTSIGAIFELKLVLGLKKNYCKILKAFFRYDIKMAPFQAEFPVGA